MARCCRRTFDWDSVLGYKTYKVVRIRDRRLGIINWVITLAVVFYIVFYIYVYKRTYYASEASTGQVALKIKGSTYARLANGDYKFFSSEDLVHPAIERGALFIATSLVVTPNQTRGLCGTPGFACQHDSDCAIVPPMQPGLCMDGLCASYQWCPAENITEASSDARAFNDDPIVPPPVVGGATEYFPLHDSGNLTIWMKATMAFPTLSDTTNYSTILQQQPILYPQDNANLYSLTQLLDLVQTPYDHIRDRGAILQVSLKWECYLNFQSVCIPDVQVARLDNRSVATGFNFRDAVYYRDSTGTLHRDLNKYTGVRMFFISQGKGYLISVVAIIMQFSQGLALLALARVVTDFLLMYVMPQRRRYREYKVLETEDFIPERVKPSRYGADDDTMPVLAGRVNPL